MISIKRIIDFLDKHLIYQNELNNLWPHSRSISFPQEVSENIAIHIVRAVLGVNVLWAKEPGCKISGDAYIPETRARLKLRYFKNHVRVNFEWSGMKKVEIKCFTSDGPISFGPTEIWDVLYFLDAKDYKNHLYKLYEFSRASNSSVWENIKVNTTQNITDQTKQGRRVRLSFENIKKQLGTDCNLVWSGNIKHLKINDEI